MFSFSFIFDLIICIYLCVCVCVCVYIYVCVCVCVCRYMCVCIYIYIYMYVCVYIYICNNTLTHIHTHTHTHTHTCPTYERLPYYSRAFPRPLFLGVFAKLRKRLLSSLYTSVRPSVRMEQLSSYWTDFHDMFSKICQENSSSIKI